MVGSLGEVMVIPPVPRVIAVELQNAWLMLKVWVVDGMRTQET